MLDRLKTWHEVEALFNKHLTPADRGPKDQLINLLTEIDDFQSESVIDHVLT